MEENGNVYIRTCKHCGQKFETTGRRTQLCDVCKSKRKTENTKRQNSLYKKPKVKDHILKDGISLREYTAIIERYNQKHRTSYTYGQFTSLVRAGKIRLSQG